MSDEHLRELERRFAASGAVEDEAAFLRESVRLGKVSREALALRAYTGSEGARLALGREPAPRRLAPEGALAAALGRYEAVHGEAHHYTFESPGSVEARVQRSALHAQALAARDPGRLRGDLAGPLRNVR